MDFHSTLGFALPLCLGMVGLGVAIALGKSVSEAMAAIGRQPEASTKILIAMATGCAFIEAIAIYALVFCFNLAGKI